MAAAVTAATATAAKPTVVAPGPGAVITFNSANNRCGETLKTKGTSPCLKKNGTTTEFTPQSARPLPKLPSKADLQAALAKQLRALKISSRSQPPKRATGSQPPR